MFDAPEVAPEDLSGGAELVLAAKESVRGINKEDTLAVLAMSWTDRKRVREKINASSVLRWLAVLVFLFW